MPETRENDVILSDQSLALLDELSVGAFTVDVQRKARTAGKFSPVFPAWSPAF